MIYDRKPSYGDGQWHCPFPKEWVERMKHAAKYCKRLTAEYIEASINGEVYNYKLSPWDFLDEPQDARGLPLWWCAEEERRHRYWPNCCIAIYDYDTVPDIIITDGYDDWTLKIWEPLMTA